MGLEFNKINCPNCGAPIDNDAEICEYCNTPIPKDTSMNNLIIFDYIKNAEEKIKHKKNKYDLLVFMVLFISGVGLYFLYRLMGEIHVVVKILIIVVVGIIVFAAWGLIIQKLESKASEEYFENELKQEIEGFNSQMGIDYLEFSKKAAEILPEKAYLRRFLYKK